MNNQNNVERFYNKTTQQIMRFQPLFTNLHGDMVIGVSLDTDNETDYYDGEPKYVSHTLKRGDMVMVQSPNSIGRGNRVKMSYKGKDLFTYVRNLKRFDIPNWIHHHPIHGNWKNYDVIVGNN